ncbi:hypothetical protein D3H35_28095 [Cohnella faecalis]|uniref:Uncharacterized protein n=1 Tax=Cohnella faecalis TaxID=2315694 RepID=A0A398CKU4_9BACL|nr:hypothetical protein D3H35_28095 [Cohnella faecalis]
MVLDCFDMRRRMNRVPCNMRWLGKLLFGNCGDCAILWLPAQICVARPFAPCRSSSSLRILRSFAGSGLFSLPASQARTLLLGFPFENFGLRRRSEPRNCPGLAE